MIGRKPCRVLVAYSCSSTHVPTTYEYLLALKKFSDYEVKFVHVTHGARLDFDINDFDVVLQNYCARLCFDDYVSDHYQQALMNFRGLKIISVQDDYDRTDTLHRAIRRLGFHVLLTCIQKQFWPLVYPKSVLPGVTIVQGLLGYVPDSLVEHDHRIRPLVERKNWLAYRGRDIGARYGRLGFDKYEIGRRMAEICAERGIPHDIAMDDASRIYGDAWFEFLGSTRAVLGTESGSNAFDFDGSLERAIQEFAKLHGRPPTFQEFKHILDPLEIRFDVGQVSPRVFEAAAMKTPMILFRGSYSTLIEPGVDYIALEKDFSNASGVLSQLDDLGYLQGFAERAYDKLVKSQEFGHRRLARLLEEIIEEEFPKRVDPAWIAYRDKMSQHWRSFGTQTVSKVNSCAAAAEKATELPLGLEHFKSKQIAIAIERVSGRAPPTTLLSLLSRSFLYAWLRRGWRLLPKGVRHRVWGWYALDRS